MLNNGEIDLISLFQSWAALHPDSVAMEDCTQSVTNPPRVTYRELDECSNRFARKLKHNGIRYGDAVPLLSRRSPEAIIAILAILKCGACYVPMDADTWAQDRIQMTLQQIQPRLVVSTNSAHSTFPTSLWKVLDMPSWKEVLDSPFALEHQTNTWEDVSQHVSQLDRLAYIIFTSGTTGKPKGVMVSMRSITAYCRECDPNLPFNLACNPNSRVLCVVSIAFDACVGVIFSSMTSGGTLVLANPSTFTAAAKLCSVLPLTPSILSSLDPNDGFENIKAIYMGGESPSPALIEAWSGPGRRIFNAYGPTEATCATLLSELFPGGPITVGWPIWYSKIILVDSDGRTTKEEGEIYIGGDGLAVGYYGNEEATGKAFVIHDGERFYKTGDLARLTDDGFVFRGRMDSMVKNRGFLVSLEAEVEPAILSCPGLTGAVAMKIENSLVAFISPAVHSNRVRKHLNDNFSTFLVPDTIYALDEFPQTANGKTDRKQLQSFHQARLTDSNMDSAVSPYSSHSLSPLEAAKKAFALILRLPEPSTGPDTSFLQNGGHSLSAVRLVSALRKLGFATSVTEILARDTVDAVAKALTPLMKTFSASLTSNKGNAPMTDLQLRMLRATMQSPVLHYIKIGMTFEHRGTHAISKTLRRVWNTIYQTHEILRTTFDLSVENGVQVIDESFHLDWDESVVSEEHWDNVCAEAIDMNRWDQSSSHDTRPLSSTHLIIIPSYRTRLIWTVHHSLIDGWSAAKLLGDLTTLLNDGQLPQDYPQFGDAARLVHELTMESDKQAFQYWRSIAQGYFPAKKILLAYPHDNKSLAKVSAQADVHESLGLPVTALEGAAIYFGVTSSTIMYAAWALLLSRYCDSEKIALGAVVAGRTLPVDGIEDVVGPLINTLPLCVDTNQSDVGTLLNAVSQSLYGLLDVQYSTHALIQEACATKSSELFETVLAIQYDFPTFGPTGKSEMVPTEVEFRESTELPLTVLVNEVDGVLETRLLYSCHSYDRDQATKILQQFHSLVHAIVQTDSQGSLDEINSHTFDGCDEPCARLTDTPSKKEVTDADSENFDGPHTIQLAIQDSISRFPDFCAVATACRSLSYHQLDCVMNIVASQINEVTAPGDVVGIISDGSIEWLVAILAVIQSGCTYCPIDVKLPKARQHYMINSTSVKLVLLPHASMRSEYAFLGDVKVWDIESLVTQKAARKNYGYRAVEESDIAVIIFTSGSKGVPKAVQLTHKGIMSLLSSPEGRLYSKPGWRIAQTLSLGFDCCVLEVFSAIGFGGTLVLKNIDDPLAHLSIVDATVATPSLLATLSPENYRNLQVVFLLGEALHQNLVDRWRPGRIVQNCYGPAECTLFVTYKRFDEADERVSIGKPVGRMRCYLLDKKQRRVPLGVKGEIYISGVQVTPGYRNDAVQSAAAFLPDPFTRGCMMFKTGDMGRLLRDGNIEYIGREDDLFKIRGFRVDLGDIEASILVLAPDVQNIAVVVPPAADLLLAFVTPMSVNISVLQERIKRNLPPHMIPARITALADLPLSPNHKVDRKQLASMSIPSARAIVPLATPTEKLVARIWRDVLGESPLAHDISASDHFLTIGGHSLLQIRVAQRLGQTFNIPFPLVLVIRHPTLQDLSRAVDNEVLGQRKRKAKDSFLLIKPSSRAVRLPVSFLEEELLVNDLVSGSSPAMNIIFATEFNKLVWVEVLDQAFKECVKEREIFLSRYVQIEGKYARTLVPTPASIHRFTSAELSFDEFLDAAKNYHFSLEKEQPVQAYLYQHSTGKVTLVILMSHLIGDAITISGFIKSFSTRYNAFQNRDPYNPAFHLADLRGKRTYIDWTAWSMPQEKIPDEVSSFWEKYLASPPLHARLNKFHRPRSYNGGYQSWKIPSSCSQSLLEICTDMSISPHQLMLAAVAMTTQSLRPSQDIIMMAPYSLRNEPGTENLAGCLLDRVLIRVRWEKAYTLREFLQSVHQASQSAMAHFVPCSALFKSLQLQPSLTDSLAEIMVTFHSKTSLDNPLDFGQTLTIRPTGAKFPLLFEFFQSNEDQNQISMFLEYDEAILTSHESECLVSAFQLVLTLIAEHKNIDEIVSTVSNTSEDVHPVVIHDTSTKSESDRASDPSSSGTQPHYVEAIREAFATCLDINMDSVDPESSFFDLGASSIDAVKLVWLLAEKDICITARQVLLERSPARLDRVLRS
ncbi:AMP-dependent synthetase/ligase [Penicillium pulvis]|uniref:AMP-dependent synthetase/ligase n=1 Tax=Penicillium pulvis TaxID=1562058 RepID=UPI00254712CE|nr:AMP-dependent synthetase/ligase [Penicillium pulvis]KAJ5805380.1 AMP-dependent synthetase/ligase [Penicillium pulvis]